MNLIEALQTATNGNKPHVTTTPDTPMLPHVAAFRPTAVPRAGQLTAPEMKMFVVTSGSHAIDSAHIEVAFEPGLHRERRG